jgi:hypothetical protein
MAKGDRDDQDNLKAIYGALFFGVPSRGIKIEHLLPMVQGQPNEHLIQNLAPDSKYLRRLHESFRSGFSFQEIVFIYETERTKTAKVRP